MIKRKNKIFIFDVQSGFTLIELLVVIAIIGVLVSVVLASLNTSRAKGADAAAKSALLNVIPQAEVYYNTNNNSFLNICRTKNVNGIANLLISAAKAQKIEQIDDANNISYYAINISPNTGNHFFDVTKYGHCYDSENAWAVDISLSSGVGQYFCVDSSGASETTSFAPLYSESRKCLGTPQPET